MKLPGVDRAVIKTAKIHDYLVSRAHPVGRFKAAFFTSLGYSAAEWEVLAEVRVQGVGRAIAIDTSER